MADGILTLNAGSSSIKFALFAREATIPRQPVLVGQIDGIGAAGQAAHLKAKDAAGRTLDDADLDLAADALYLDGFSPARNPELWSPEICAALARCAAPGAAC